jgi:hypothetical protein
VRRGNPGREENVDTRMPQSAENLNFLSPADRALLASAQAKLLAARRRHGLTEDLRSIANLFLLQDVAVAECAH